MAKKRKNPHARSSSLWPADICARLYQLFQLKRANQGKPTPLRINYRAIQCSRELPAKPSKIHKRWVVAENACFCVDIQGNKLTSWIEYASPEKIHGERKIESIPLTAFSEVYLIDEKTIAHLIPQRYRAAVGVGGGLTTLSHIKWIERGSELISVAEWIPGVGEWAVILGAAASCFASKRSRVAMKNDDGIWFVMDMPQRAFHLMDALLHCPDWEFEAPPHFR